jgi:hypothetical protein
MKATKAQVQARVEEVLAIRLDGAEFWHVREYAREKEQEEGSVWHLAQGQKPLSDGQLWRYLRRADQMIAASFRASRKKLLRRHLGWRRNLYAKAVSSGDYRAALAAARDECELLGLYPPKGVHVTGKGAAPLILQIKEEIVLVGREPAAALTNIVEEVAPHDNGGRITTANGETPPGTASLPQE